MNDMEKWSVNESLLQSYRSVFISSQSFLLAVGAIVADKSTMVLLATAGVGTLMIWAIWFPVVVARHRIVDYYKYRASLPESRRPELCSESDYVKDRTLRRKANEVLGLKTNWRPTRRKIDLLIPFLFSFVWIVLLLYRTLYA